MNKNTIHYVSIVLSVFLDDEADNVSIHHRVSGANDIRKQTLYNNVLLLYRKSGLLNRTPVVITGSGAGQGKFLYSLSDVGKAIIAASRSPQQSGIGICPKRLCDQLASHVGAISISDAIELVRAYLYPGKDMTQKNHHAHCLVSNDRFKLAKASLKKAGLITTEFYQLHCLNKVIALTERGKSVIQQALYHPETFEYHVPILCGQAQPRPSLTAVDINPFVLVYLLEACRCFNENKQMTVVDLFAVVYLGRASSASCRAMSMAAGASNNNAFRVMLNKRMTPAGLTEKFRLKGVGVEYALNSEMTLAIRTVSRVFRAGPCQVIDTWALLERLTQYCSKEGYGTLKAVALGIVVYLYCNPLATASTVIDLFLEASRPSKMLTALERYGVISLPSAERDLPFTQRSIHLTPTMKAFVRLSLTGASHARGAHHETVFDWEAYIDRIRQASQQAMDESHSLR